MKDIYEKTPEERKLLGFQNSVNSYSKTLETHTRTLINMYESGDGYEIGLKFIIASLKLIEAYDSEKHDELKELLSHKIDSPVDES